MANDYTGRIWKITGTGTTPFGTLNIKIKGGTWAGDIPGKTFTITDVAGRVYSWAYPADGSAVNFQELGWLSGPVAFSGNFTAEVNLFLGTK